MNASQLYARALVVTVLLGRIAVALPSPVAEVVRQEAYLKAASSQASDLFGQSVALSGDTLIVGAHGEDSGVVGNPADNGESNAGAALVFVRGSGGWVQQAYLKASNAESFDVFGWSVAVSGDLLVVGARLADLAAPDAGAAYTFEHTTQGWVARPDLLASNADPADWFGGSVAVSGELIAVGASYEGSAAQGVDGDQGSNAASASGAAYVFEALPIWSAQGFALSGAGGDPVLAGSGPLTEGSANAVELSNAAPSAVAGLFLALGPVAPLPFKGGTLAAVPLLVPPVIVPTGAAGTISTPFVMPAGVPAGTELWVQWAVQDGGAVFGVALSNAVRGVTP